MGEVESFLNIFSIIAGGIKKFWKWIKKSNLLAKEQSEDQNLTKINQQEEMPYFFKDYKKHITIYPNGNGIIINSATMVVKDKEKLDYIYRKLNVEDGKENVKFPTLENMVLQAKENRFDKFGFWYYSEDGIISNAEEWYWSDTDPTEEDEKIKQNDKEIRWRFRLNKSRINEGKEYKLEYAVSVEGMYPIEQGQFNPSIANDPNSVKGSSSNISVLQEIEDFTYEVSFEDGIELQLEPQCDVCRILRRKKIPVPIELRHNIFYKKYIFNVKHPILDSKIKVHWKFKGTEG